MKHVSIFRRGHLLLALFLTGDLAARAQNVGIGTSTPNQAAALDVTSTMRGMLPPPAQGKRIKI